MRGGDAEDPELAELGQGADQVKDGAGVPASYTIACRVSSSAMATRSCSGTPVAKDLLLRIDEPIPAAGAGIPVWSVGSVTLAV
jgi:hypothetical protein